MKSSANTSRFIKIIIFTESLLFIPLVAMNFSTEVNWNINDFLVMGILLFSLGSMIELVLRRTKKENSRALLIGTLILIFVLVWAEMAVGIFDSPIAGE